MTPRSITPSESRNTTSQQPSQTKNHAVTKILVHSKKLGWRPDKNTPKGWRPSGGVQCYYPRRPSGEESPSAQALIPLELKDFEALRKIAHGFAKFFGDKYTGELKHFWETAVSFQESVMQGNDTATDYDFFNLRPCVAPQLEEGEKIFVFILKVSTKLQMADIITKLLLVNKYEHKRYLILRW